MEVKALSRTAGHLMLEGNLDAESEQSLASAVNEAHRNGITSIVLDFRPSNHIDSRGAAALVKLVVLAGKLGTGLSAFGLSERYRDIFSLTGIMERLPACEGDLHLPGNAEAAKGRQDNSGWSPPVGRLKVTEKPEKAMNKNVDNRKVFGPLQGFGYLWQKTYLLDIRQPKITPAEVIAVMKQHFPEFQPAYNSFYATSRGIEPGEVVLIDSRTPGGIVSTGVLVLYADATSFSFITPAGHPEAGWVTFSAAEKDSHVAVKIEGFASASDPLYEFAFRIAGSAFQETIWKTVLSSLAKHIGAEDNVRMEKTVVDKSLHWSRSGNLWYNAQLRSLPYNITRLFSRK